MDRTLPRPLTVPWRWWGVIIFAPLASLSALHLAVYQDRPWALLTLLAVPLALRWPAVMIAASALLMVGYAGTGYADQTDLGRAAWQSFLAGDSPYRIHDLGTHS